MAGLDLVLVLGSNVWFACIYYPVSLTPTVPSIRQQARYMCHVLCVLQLYNLA